MRFFLHCWIWTTTFYLDFNEPTSRITNMHTHKSVSLYQIFYYLFDLISRYILCRIERVCLFMLFPTCSSSSFNCKRCVRRSSFIFHNIARQQKNHDDEREISILFCVRLSFLFATHTHTHMRSHTSESWLLTFFLSLSRSRHLLRLYSFQCVVVPLFRLGECRKIIKIYHSKCMGFEFHFLFPSIISWRQGEIVELWYSSIFRFDWHCLCRIDLLFIRLNDLPFEVCSNQF